ncbi:MULTISPECIES: hypothetical protein [Listeria]|uniref:hypothetical protein n=1 Tax=Listeria TaxID=1637 RepID=UPI000B5938D6|nr:MULTISPECIES: hypothetical protein [Listeria]
MKQWLLDTWTRWDDQRQEKAHYLGGKTKYFYYGMALVTVFVFSWLGYKVLTYQTSLDTDSGVGVPSQLALNTTTVQMISRQYNPHNQYLEILVQAKSEDFQWNEKLETIVTEGEEKQRLPHTFLRVTDQYYVLGVKNVPADWHVIYIDVGLIVAPENRQVDVDLGNLLGEKGAQKQADGTTVYQDLWTLNHEKTKRDVTLQPKTESDYVIQYTQLEIQESQKLIQKIDTYMANVKKEQKRVKNEIEKLQQEERYQTETEIENTEDTIHNLQANVAQLEADRKKQQTKKAELQEKIEKLQLQQRDQKKKK